MAMHENRDDDRSDSVTAVRLTNIYKRFGRTEALKGMSFRVLKGERVALLGPNGAGKTTTLKVAVGLLQPDAGEVRIYGDTNYNSRSLFGYLPEDAVPYMNLSVEENLEYIGALREIGDADRRAETLVDILNLKQYRKIRCSKLSRGNKQKLCIALSLIHKPQLLILDEPLSYLDIPTQETVIDMLQKEFDTILLSTHIMSIATRLTDSIIMIANGQTVWEGTKKQLEELGKPDEPIEKLVGRMMRSVS